MRTLKFIVEGQKMSIDPSCNLDDLIPGSEGYLNAEFSFSSDWTGCVKVAGFYSMLGTEYPPQILKDGKSCVIPAEALVRRTFKVQIVGMKTDTNTKFKTNKVTVKQNGGIK